MISIILVEPENADNIGAVARAMKNMGLSALRLVKPPRGWKKKARKMAVGAVDLLEKAAVFGSLQEAIADQHSVIATSRRQGSHRGLFRPLPDMIRLLRRGKRKFNHAVVFGRESKGLSNRDIALCDWVTTIPSSAAYPSLNLSQAVMIIGFCLFRDGHRPQDSNPPALRTYASQSEIQDVLARIESALPQLGYREEGPDVMGRIVKTFHRLIKRAGLLQSEANMLKGLSRRILQKM